MGVALNQFKESLELAKALKTLENKYSTPPISSEQSIVKGLRGGAAVILVAAFEYFLRKLFEENISRLNAIPQIVDFSKLPDELRVKTVFDGIKMAMDGPKYENKPSKVDRIDNIIAASKLIINGHLNPEIFTETGSNPNSATVIEKFKEVGVREIFIKIKEPFQRQWGQKVAETFIVDKLDEIVRTRHVVAHTADTLNITRASQEEAFKFLEILAQLLEEELKLHIERLLVTAKK